MSFKEDLASNLRERFAQDLIDIEEITKVENQIIGYFRDLEFMLETEIYKVPKIECLIFDNNEHKDFVKFTIEGYGILFRRESYHISVYSMVDGNKQYFNNLNCNNGQVVDNNYIPFSTQLLDNYLQITLKDIL